MADKEDSIKFWMNYCTHYDGRSLTDKGGHCKKGIVYRDVFGHEPGIVNRLPCLNCAKGTERTERESLQLCSSFQRTTREEAIQIVDHFDKKHKALTLVLPVVNDWRSPKGEWGKEGIIKCPVCGGQLHLIEANYNGHIQANCLTPDCVSFIE